MVQFDFRVTLNFNLSLQKQAEFVEVISPVCNIQIWKRIYSSQKHTDTYMAVNWMH